MYQFPVTSRYNQYQAEEATYSVQLETDRPGVEASGYR